MNKASLTMIVIFFCFLLNEIECNVNATIEQRKLLRNLTRRILRGNEVGETRPYMVYLRPSQNADAKDPKWLCGGVIIHEHYILTSAACIEDVQQFYVVSGTHKWEPADSENDCIKNGAKRAVWKCVPKDYVFDGKSFENIRWMENDIAVVKVESDFDFTRRIRGCDFKPDKIPYNNKSKDLESPGKVASVAGWGSVDKFEHVIGRSVNSPELLETDVLLISKRKCKARWPERYHYIIDRDMICGKDSVDGGSMSAICLEQDINCKELVHSDEDEYNNENTNEDKTRKFNKQTLLEIHSARHLNNTRRSKTESGGFCENDHGGPLVHGQGKSAIVIGIISACMTTDVTQKCHGPFLYTSVWKNRHVISCAIHKDRDATCRRLLRSGTHYDWPKNIARSLSKQYPQLHPNKFIPRSRTDVTKQLIWTTKKYRHTQIQNNK